MRLSVIVPLVGALILSTLAGCGEDAKDSATPVTDTSSASASAHPNDPSQPRTRLAAWAAAAKDQRLTAFYVLKSQGHADRTVSIIRAADGSWRVDIPGGAHGGAVDIALVFTGNALHQCVLPAGGCVRVQGKLPADSDPKIQHLITDWLDIFTDRQQALAVSVAHPLQGAAGECYAIESSAVSLKLPVDVGIYCYERDGTLTAAKMSFGTILLAGKPGAAPPALALPGPVVTGALLTLAAPPSPTATASPKG
ncbi:hypothetical protein Rhe02_70750 [Rhizocola hellebori]|uniref:Lipoprotein n=1 Tax=Rhizocola hellebori TaxID=1392758 RepID=A0A8J3QGH7_9ACTN|nr:hypothetical protein [Rhizocola hellebori]GIH09008.1 hypothetical protein Rhe02_70750 [Rhizocola hellebori]